MPHPFLTRPVFAIGASVVLIASAGTYAFFAGRHTPTYSFVNVQQGSITQSASVSGVVEAAEDAALSFQKSGQVQTIDVQVGDKVQSGQVIASIDTRDASAAVAEATAALQAAQANAQKVQDGATTTQTDVAKAAVESATVALQNATQNIALIKTQQATAVANAEQAMLNAGLAAIATSNQSSVLLTVSGTYTGAASGSYTVTTYATGSGLSYQYSGLEAGFGPVTTGIPLPLGKDGLFVTFSSTGTILSNSAWTIQIPNTQSPAYLAAYNAYQTALQIQTQALASSQEAEASAQAAVDQAQAELEATITPARPEDVATAQAEVASAQANVEAAQNEYADSLITAPFSGRIGSLTIKIGDAVAPGQAVGTLVSNGQAQFDVQLSDADFAHVRVGDTAAVTFDAYPNVSFPATLLTIDASPSTDDASSHEAVLNFVTPDARLAPGLEGEAIISDKTHTQALLVPSASVITDGAATFLFVKNPDGTTTRRQVTTGIENAGQTEIVSGVNAGDQVASF